MVYQSVEAPRGPYVARMSQKHSAVSKNVILALAKAIPKQREREWKRDIKALGCVHGISGSFSVSILERF